MNFKTMIAAASLLLPVVTANAFEIDTEACAGTEFIYDLDNNLVKYDPAIHTFVDENTQVFYAGEAFIPHLKFATNGIYYNSIDIVNVQEHPISIFYKPKYFSSTDGSEAFPNPELFYGAFSTSNNPKTAAGATLQPSTRGQIFTRYTTLNGIGNATVEWDSSHCFATPPVVASVEITMSHGDRFGWNNFLLNEGKPF